MNREQRRREARAGRSAVTSTGTMHDRGAALIDTRGAVLLDHVNTVIVHTNIGDAAGIELAGRVNRSSARASTLYLCDAEGAGRLAADLVTLAARQGATDEAWAATFRVAFDDQLTAGTTPTEEPQA